MAKFTKSGPGGRRGGKSGGRPEKSGFKARSGKPSRFAKSNESGSDRRPSRNRFEKSSGSENSRSGGFQKEKRFRDDSGRSSGPDSGKRFVRDGEKKDGKSRKPFEGNRERKNYSDKTRSPRSEKRTFGKSEGGKDRVSRTPGNRIERSHDVGSRGLRDRKNFSNRTKDSDSNTGKRSSSEGFYLQKETDERQSGKSDSYERKSIGVNKKEERTSPRPRIRTSERERSANKFEEKSGTGRRNTDSRSPERKWNRKEDHEFYGDRKKSARFEKSPRPPKQSAADEGLTRLNKFIANAGICSRREADEMIKAGVITVNDKIVTEMGYKVQSGDVVKYNNETLRGEQLVYVLLNKPKDFITTTDDPEERKTVMSLIANAGKERVYPVGRLDRNTTGLLLFTNDGDLARKLTHPSFEVQKVYQVELDKSLKTSDMDKIIEGVNLEDGFIKVDDIAYTTDDKSVLGVELHSGKNRIVRRLFEHLGYSVKKLDRVIFAGLTKKDLPRGRWRFLSEMEIANLKMITGNKKFAGKGSSED